MAGVDYHRDSFVVQLNAFQLELGMLRDGIDHIFHELHDQEVPDWMLSSAHIFSDRFLHLVETFPFPPEIVQEDSGQVGL